MSKKKIKQGLSLVMSLLLCVTSANFSMLANAAEANATRIIGFNQLDESIATQNLPVGASIEDVVFPESIKATVETVEEIEVKKLIEKEKPDEAEDEEVVSTDEDDTDVETEDKAAEPGEKAEETTADETIVEEEPTEPEAEQPEEIPAEETTESEPDATEDTEKEEAVDSSFIDILFPAMIVHAAEQEEEPSLVSGAMAVSTEPEYKTVVEKKVVHSEITISDVKWEIEYGAKFDSSKEASFVFKPVFNTDYTINAETPTIKVNIVNTDSKTAFEKSQVVDGVRVNVKADAGVFPEGATLSVTKVSGSEEQAVENAVEEKRDDDKNVVESYTFDIKVLDKDGKEIEPDTSKGKVKVSFTLEEVANVNLETDVYHVKGEVGDLTAEELEAEEVGTDTVEAATDGFSYYTVEFTYNNLQYVMNGDTTVALSKILETVGLSGNVEAVVSSNPELFKAENNNGAWQITALQAFHSDETLTVTLDGVEYVITVTDVESYDLWVGGTQVTSANMNNIPAAVAENKTAGTASFDPNTYTLTLDGYTYEGDCATGTTGDENKHAVVYAKKLPYFNLKIKGTVSITQTDATTIDSVCGLYLWCQNGTNEISIIGIGDNPKLIVSAGKTKFGSYGTSAGLSYSSGSCDIQNCTIEARSTDTQNGIGSFGISGSPGPTISNCTINAYGGNNSTKSAGIKTGDTSAIKIYNSVVVASGDVSSNNSYGIVSNSAYLHIYNPSDVTMQGNKAATTCTVKVHSTSAKGYNNYAMSGSPISVISDQYSPPLSYIEDPIKAIKVTPHTHSSLDYSSDGDTITAACDDEDCYLTDGIITLQIIKPTLTSEGGSGVASATLDNLQDFNAATGLTLAETNIEYAAAGNTVFSTTAPTTRGSYVARIKAGSVYATVSYEIGNPPKAAPSVNEAREAANISYTNEAVTPNGVQISSSNETYVQVTSLTPILDGSSSPKIYVRYPADDEHSPSAWVEVTLTARPAAPGGITVEKTSGESAADGKINGTTTDMEYKATGDASYTTASDGSTTVQAGTYLVRDKATESTPAGNTIEVTVGTKTDQAPPSTSGISVVKTTGDASDGSISNLEPTMEYSSDNGSTWNPVPSATITGLSAGTYLIRYQENADKNPSEPATIVLPRYIVLDDSTDVTIINENPQATIPAVGDTLSVLCEATGLAYQWLRAGEAIQGATNASYTVTADDVGEKLSVRVTQVEDRTGATISGTSKPSAETNEVKKGEQAPPNTDDITVTKATVGNSNGSISGLSSTMEYALDGVVWTPVGGTTLTNLSEGVYQIRYAGDAGKLPSNPVTIVVSIYRSLDESTEIAIKKGSQEITTPVVGDTLTVECGATDLSYQWLRAGQAIPGATNASYTVTADDVGKTLSVEVRQTEDRSGNPVVGSYKISDSTTTVKKTEQASPNTDGITVIKATVGNSNGSISGLTTTMEYAIAGGEWTPVGGTTLMNLSAGEYQIRYAGDAGKLPSDPLNLVVSEFSPLDDSTEVVINKGSQEIATPAVGDTLTVMCKATDLSYQWLRAGQAIPGATNASYTVTADDVGEKLSVRVTQVEDRTGTTISGASKPSAETNEVKKGEQATPNTDDITVRKVTEGNSDGSISGLSSTMEYALDDGVWKPVGGTTLTNLSEGVYQIRYAGDAGKLPSNPVTIVVSIYRPLDESTEIAINKGSQEITTPVVGDTLTVECGATDLSYQWLRAGEAIQGATGISYTVTSEDVGKAISIKVTQVEDITGHTIIGNAKVSEATQPVTKQEQEPPSAKGITPSSATSDAAEGTISGVTTDMEYSKDGGDSWIKVTENPITGLKPGTYLIRYAGDAVKAPSEAVVVVVEDSTPEVVDETGIIKVTAEKDTPDVPNTAVYVTIKKGNDVIFFENIGTLGEEGLSFEFPEMPIGSYTVICKADDGNFVETQLLNVAKNEQVTASFRILKGEIKTVVEVVGDTPPVAVDGLRSLLTDEEKEKAASTDGYKVEIKLTADEKKEDEAEGTEEIKEQLSGNQTIDQILDFSLMKSITSDGKTTSQGISEAGSVLEIAISYVLAAGKNLSMFRFHAGTAQILQLLSGKPETVRDGTFYYDAASQFIHLFSSRFSTYAIAVEDEASGSGSDSSSEEGVATVPVYRLFNPTKGYHFYTADIAERDALVAAGWNDEGIAWQAGDKNGKPVYRLFDVNGTGGHIFTTSEEEKAAYIAKGFRDEGIAWFAPSYAGRKVYKITNKANGHVLYTISLDEKNSLEAAGFVCEEAGFVVY